jgi:hypothetical protein
MNSLSRRSFLRLSAGMVALSRLRPVLAATATTPAVGFQVLSPADAAIFGAIAARMVDCGTAGFPKLSDTQAMTVIDQTLLVIDASLQSQVRWLLKIVQYCPPLVIRRLSTFTGLSDTDQDEVLRRWSRSNYEIGRIGFRALKNLSMLGYYSQDVVWPFIHYRGPWVPRPRKMARLAP